ncbi:MAG: F0F1 ATP synthase subunit A [Flavobacteriaceae bacterium]|nr:F0F1 ATP synthase subunit A [Flavobacteriaceae bacterium]
MIKTNNKIRSLKFFLFIGVIFTTVFVNAKDKEEKLNSKELQKKEIKDYIAHHLEDSYYFDLFSYTNDKNEKKYIGFPLPIFLWDNGVKIFSSSKFNHGKSVVNIHGDFYKIYHNKIYKTDFSGTINYDKNNHPSNFRPYDFSITKGVSVIILTSILMFVLFRSLANSYSKNRGLASGLGRFFEPIVIYIRDEIAIPNIGEKHYKKYMSFLLTIFFFIWFLNMLGLTPFGINVTGNIAITFSLAILTFIITNFTANKNYWAHIFWMPGVPTLMKIVLAPIEVLGVFIKPFTLMLRLYANMQAGHIVMMSLIALMFIFFNWIGSSLSFFLAFFISIIELFVALLQAYIFTILSALYFGFANEEHEHNETH